MDPADCPTGQICVEQQAESWRVMERNRPVEDFDRLDAAVTRALELFRERRQERKQIVVLPPVSPWMWD